LGGFVVDLVLGVGGVVGFFGLVGVGCGVGLLVFGAGAFFSQFVGGLG
jgi:hypothetical protein